MRRVLFYRVHDLAPAQLRELERDAEEFATSRDWRGDRFWLATEVSVDLFGMEYFRHASNEEGRSLAGAGFIKLGGDETDALATLFFLDRSSQRFQARTVIKDEDNPIAKLRHLEIRAGRLPGGLLSAGPSWWRTAWASMPAAIGDSPPGLGNGGWRFTPSTIAAMA